MNLLDQIKIHKPYGSSEVGADGSTFIDCQGFSGVLFLLTKNGSSGIASTGAISIQQSTGTSTSGAIASTFTSKFKASGRNPMAIDVVKPVRRYVRLKMLTCTGIAVTAIAYGGKRLGSTENWAAISSSNRPSGIHVCTT